MKLVLYLLALLVLGVVGVAAIYLRFLVVLICIAGSAVRSLVLSVTAGDSAGTTPTGGAVPPGRPMRRSRRTAA